MRKTLWRLVAWLLALSSIAASHTVVSRPPALAGTQSRVAAGLAGC